jgi:hypothetical protein
MRLPAAYLTIGLLVSTTYASPLPQKTPPLSDFTDNDNLQIPEFPPPSSPSTITNLALAGLSTALLFGTTIGLSEWALNWYTRFQRHKHTRSQQNQTLQDARLRRKEQWARKERAMDLMLEMADNYSETVVAGGGDGHEEFDGRFEPLVVPGAIVGAVENVFEQTVEGEGGRDSLEGLKKALKPLLAFRKEEGKKG